MGLYLNIFSI